jgi:hypothetical protein
MFRQTVEVIAYCIRVDALRNCNLQFIGEPEQVAMFCIDRSEKDLILRAPCESRHKFNRKSISDILVC